MANGQLTPGEITDFAFTVCYVASPSYPELPSDMDKEQKVQLAIDWLIDSVYIDEHIKISICGAEDSNGKKGLEICIFRSDTSVSEDDITVFIAYDFTDYDATSSAEDRLIDVELFKHGPWMDHLITVGHRALSILQNRGEV
jgi:hypothetical protein